MIEVGEMFAFQMSSWNKCCMPALALKDRLILSTLLGAIGLVVLADLISDRRAGSSWSHAGLELFVVAILFVSLVWLWVRKSSELARMTRSDFERQTELEAEALKWRTAAESLRPGLRAAMEQQFKSWRLTQAESETAMLVLKGLANKEIAAVRDCSELTVKQQTNAIFRKSGLSSRTQLIAFFLEDLF